MVNESPTERRIAVVTGANRGLGFETSRQLARAGYHVIVTGRRIRRVQAAVKALQQKGLAHTEAALLDVTDEPNIREFVRQTMKRHGRIDVLVNNAGQAFSKGFGEEQSVFDTPARLVLAAFETNTLGAYRLTQAVLPHMNRAGYGRVVNVSSGLGALTDMDGGWPAYRISKTALNAVTRVFAAEAARNVKVNSVCPGWTRTDLGGPDADRSVAYGARGIVWAATLSDNGPNGGFFRDGEPIDW
ncbi:MAG: SDR family NAD(P)-dependent oxidoreductase [Thiohalomonadaceae bacterium]